MSLSPIHESPDKMLGGKKELFREMSDSSPSYSPVPGKFNFIVSLLAFGEV